MRSLVKHSEFIKAISDKTSKNGFYRKQTLMQIIITNIDEIILDMTKCGSVALASKGPVVTYLNKSHA